jgi:SAM-dependent methyltransferase
VPARDEWPGAEHRDPPLGSSTYTVRAPLAAWLCAEAARAGGELGRYRVLDVGCGAKPYFPYFEPYASEYVGVDIDNATAELNGAVEDLPVPDASYDVVLCTQVLEHALDPARGVSELSRVVAPGGRVLASTHGVQVYHPGPEDFWRWTHTGLERLFREHGTWETVTVRPSSGTTACVGMVLAIYVDLLMRKRLHAGWASSALVAAINRIAGALDRVSPDLREPRPGALFANYHVVAEAPAVPAVGGNG